MITLSRLYFSELIPFARICLSATRRMPLVEQELITPPFPNYRSERAHHRFY